MQKPSTNEPVPESTYELVVRPGASTEVKASRIGVNESGALLIMKQNPETLRHEPTTIIATGNWRSIHRLTK